MASFSPEVDATPKGMDLRSLRKGPYVDNLRMEENGAWTLRPGLGVLREMDSRLTAGPDEQSVGPTARLGTCVAKTGVDGAEQLLVVSSALASRGDDTDAPAQAVYLLHVYDLDNRRISEHVMLPRSDTTPENMTYALPACWAPSQPSAGGNSDVAFSLLEGVVLFGSAELGLWAYVAPSAPTAHADRAATHTDGTFTLHAPQGESVTVFQLALSDGPLQNYLYRTDSDLPAPTALTTWQSRLVLASERSLYFSDPLNPGWWATDNRTNAPCLGTIKACAASVDVILVWTDNETWAYNPPSGVDILAGGQWYLLSGSTGCPSPRSQLKVDRAVVWTHSSGVFSHTSGLSFKKMSDQLDPFFQGAEPLSNPLSVYRLATGKVNPAGEQPPIQWYYERPTVSFHERHGELLISFPSQGFAFVLNRGAWSVWHVGSSTNATNEVVYSNTLPELEWVGTAEEVLAVARTEQLILDRTVYATCFLEVGRGGALDRTEEHREDARNWRGQWELTGLNEFAVDDGEVWIGKPVVRKPGFVTGTGTALTDESFWFPVYVIPPKSFDPIGTFDVQDLDIRVRFDQSNWTAVHVGATPEMDFDTPRIAAIGGFHPGAPVAGGEIQTYTLGGVASFGGPEIRIRYDSTANTSDSGPSLNMPLGVPNLLCWIPLIRDPNAVTSTNPWTTFVQADIVDTADAMTANAKGRWYQFGSRLGADLLDASQEAMPVDWALKTDQIGGGKEQLKCRGVYARLSSSGKATASIESGSTSGLVNVTSSSDYKDWATEAVDMGTAELPAATDDLLNEESLRARLYITSVSKQTYNNTARWGSFAAPADGNILVGDPPVDTFATSEGIRGEHFSTMLWGSAQNVAEKVAIEQVTLSVRQVGGRRRTGR